MQKHKSASRKPDAVASISASSCITEDGHPTLVAAPEISVSCPPDDDDGEGDSRQPDPVETVQQATATLANLIDSARADAGGLVSAEQGPAKPSMAMQGKDALPRNFGAYELIWEARRDALSCSYIGRREGIDQLLLIRIFNSRLTDKAQVKSIQKSAKKAAELTHLHHLTVYETDVSEDGSPYVVTEWIESESLKELLSVTKRLDIGRFLSIFNQVGEALIEAHSRQLIHGNLSPEKILLEENDMDLDSVKLIDLGMPPDPVQNAFYLSPEQRLDKNKVDERADIFTLGCIMYESLTGSPPFIGHQMTQAGLNYLHELASQFAPDSPEHNALKLLDCIIIKCLQKKPNKRFRNIRELMDALRLVSDCICRGSTKKLPPKAEKLLLFRFLDIFDKKISAVLSVWLLLGCVSIKFIGDIQVQKNIDQAQLERARHSQEEQFYWTEAIKQASQIGKPPSLIADMQWNLADAYCSFLSSADNAPENANDLRKDAIKNYKLALQYYQHGLNYESYRLQLLNSITGMWINMNTSSQYKDREDAKLKDLQGLLAKHKYVESAQECQIYLRQSEDTRFAEIAVAANNELAKRAAKPENALRYLERALYFASLSEPDEKGKDNLYECIKKLGYDPDSNNTRLHLAYDALADGDLEAAKSEFACLDMANYNVEPLQNALDSFFCLRSRTYCDLPGNPNYKEAIEPLKQILAIEEKAFGKNSRDLASTLFWLAESYRLSNDAANAIVTYKRLFSLSPRYSPGVPIDRDKGLLAYVDLLANNGKQDEARKLLEKEVLVKGKLSQYDTLNCRLIQEYARTKGKTEALKAISRTVEVPEPDKFKEAPVFKPIPRDEFEDPANKFY